MIYYPRVVIAVAQYLAAVVVVDDDGTCRRRC